MVMVMVCADVLVLRLVGGVLGTHLLQQLIRQGNLLHGGEDRLPVQLVPGGGEDGGVGVLLPQQGHRRLQLLLAQLLGPGEEDGAGGFDLVVVELAEVLHVHLHLGAVRHGDEAVQHHVRHLGDGVLHRHHHVGQLAHAGGLDEDAVRLELGLHVLQGLAEVPHQGAADAPGGHLADLDAGLLQKAAVDADLTELVLDEHQLLTGKGLGEQLFNESGLAGPQEAGDDVDLGHWYQVLCSKIFTGHYLTTKREKCNSPGKKIKRSGGIFAAVPVSPAGSPAERPPDPGARCRRAAGGRSDWAPPSAR